MAKIRFGDRSIWLPQNRPVRIALGLALVLAGALGGWLPILGFWMFPLGLIVLSVDIPRVRRWRRKLEVSWVGWWRTNPPLRRAWDWVVAWWPWWKPAPAKVQNGKAADKPPLRDSSIVP